MLLKQVAIANGGHCDSARLEGKHLFCGSRLETPVITLVIRVLTPLLCRPPVAFGS
jgi:hypothetical protein